MGSRCTNVVHVHWVLTENYIKCMKTTEIKKKLLFAKFIIMSGLLEEAEFKKVYKYAGTADHN